MADVYNLISASDNALRAHVSACYEHGDTIATGAAATRAHTALLDAIAAEHHARLLAEGALAEARRMIAKLREDARTARDIALGTYT